MPVDYDKYPKQSSQYAKWSEVGDTYIGVIKEARDGTDYDGNLCPEYVIETDDGEEVTITAGQVMLQRAFMEKRPQEGDRIRVVYSGVGEGKPGRTPPKLFTLDVKEGPHPVQNPIVADSEAPF